MIGKRGSRFSSRHGIVVAVICFCIGWWICEQNAGEPCQTTKTIVPPVVNTPHETVVTASPQPSVSILSSENDVSITDCGSSVEKLIEIEIKEDKTLLIANKLIKRIKSSKYGDSVRNRDTTGLINSFIIDKGLEITVAGGALGGNVVAKGANTLYLSFICEDNQDITKPGLTNSAREAAEKIKLKWKSDSNENLKKSCDYKKDLFKLIIPNTCSKDVINSNKKQCHNDMHQSILQYASVVGTEPFSFHDAIGCQLSTLNSEYNLQDLRHYAEHHHTVWLLKIDPREGKPLLSWDQSRKPNNWRYELQTFSMFQFSAAMIEKGLREDMSSLGDKPIFLLINALDEPLLRREQPDIPVDSSSPYIFRSTHQAEHIISADFLKEVTQWGSKSITNCQTSNYPVLSWSAIPGWHTDVIVPNKHPGSCHGFFFDPKISSVPFEKKSDTVLFRAFSVSCDPKSPGPRHRLACLAKKHNGEIKFGNTTVTLDIGGGRGYGPTGSQKFLSPTQQASCKYLLLLDGVVAAFRSTWLLQSNSLILATGAWKDVRTQLLKPWIHYIPFSLDLSNFEETLEFIVQNPTYAKWVTENAKRAGDILSGPPEDGGESFDALYFSTLVKKFPQFTKINYEGEESIPWSSDRNCDSWQQTQGRIKQCLPNTFACPNSENLPNMRQRKVTEHYFSGGD